MKNSPLYRIQYFFICRSETFALIKVIDSLIGGGCREVPLLLHFIGHADHHSGPAAGFVSIFLSS